MKYLLIFLLIINFSCATIDTKINHGFGHPYEGLTYAAEEDKCLLLTSVMVFPPFLIIALPMSVLNIVPNIAADTLVLPVDLMTKNDKPRSSHACKW